MEGFYDDINNFQNERLIFETDRYKKIEQRKVPFWDERYDYLQEVEQKEESYLNPSECPVEFLKLDLLDKIVSIPYNYFNSLAYRLNEKIHGERLPGLQNELPSLLNLQKLTLNLLETTIGLLEKTMSDKNFNVYR
jgi:hypothetical protein